MTTEYRICSRCVMDTSDPAIEFDVEGICNHCSAYVRLSQTELLPEQQRQVALERLVAQIKDGGASGEYDCVIGVSGGVDSTYVAYLVRQLGLRPLAVHMDNGWNSELAVGNIEKALKALDIDLYTYVLNWEEFKDLQIAFLKASVPDAEIPTDHAIWAVLYQTAASRNIPYILLGTNIATESILPKSWTYGILDWRYIKGIHKRFGSSRLSTFPHVDFSRVRFYYPFFKGIRLVSILDYVPYSKEQAMDVLVHELGWRSYGGKHYESIYTRFFQGYILPEKFAIDKRRAHLSNLIMSGQISRAEAVQQLAHPPYAGYMLEEDMEFVLKKLGFTPESFAQIMALPPKSYVDYPHNERLALAVSGILTKLQLGKWRRRFGLGPET